jgi:LAS superfamily LD-carboxypeptidase LdcB
MKKITAFLFVLSSVFLVGYFALTTYSEPGCIYKSTRLLSPHKMMKAPANKETVSDSIAQSFPTPNFPNDSLLINHLLGKFDYSKDPFFTSVATEHCSKPMYLQKETYKKFKEMYAEAKKEGISLKIISGTRNFNEQKAIWERKWNTNIKTMDSLKAAKTILLYSSMPTTSRHHWGTDMDINSLENSYFASGQGLKEYTWLKKNAAKFGFCQVYTDKKNSDRTGYEMEKWHWSYIPISSHYLKKYEELITYKQVKGFQASELAPKLKSIEDYVNGIDKSCH